MRPSWHEFVSNLRHIRFTVTEYVSKKKYNIKRHYNSVLTHDNNIQ